MFCGYQLLQVIAQPTHLTTYLLTKPQLYLYISRHTSWEIQVQPEWMKGHIYITFDSDLRLQLIEESGQHVN